MLNGVGVGRCKFTCNLPETRINAQWSIVQSRVRTHLKFIFREEVKRFCGYVTNRLATRGWHHHYRLAIKREVTKGDCSVDVVLIQ